MTADGVYMTDNCEIAATLRVHDWTVLRQLRQLESKMKMLTTVWLNVTLLLDTDTVQFIAGSGGRSRSLRVGRSHWTSNIDTRRVGVNHDLPASCCTRHTTSWPTTKSVMNASQSNWCTNLTTLGCCSPLCRAQIYERDWESEEHSIQLK